MNSVAVPIIAIICCTVVAIFWMSLNASAKRKKNPFADDHQINQRLEELENQVIHNLETRVANLESLLTDREYQLSEKFKEL